MVKKIILDCDPGHDDALAMTLAVANPAIDLVAVPTSAGNQTPDKTLNNALRMLTLLKRPDIPVAAGAQVPLVKPLETAPEVHGETGLDGADLPEPGFLPQSLPAIELMARVLQESTEKVTLVVTGPMTNAALFLRTWLGKKLTKSSSWAGQWGWVTGNPASSSTSSSTPRQPRSC